MFKILLVLIGLFLCPLTIQAADAATTESEGVDVPEVYFVDIETIMIPLVHSGRKPKTFMVNITAEVSDEDVVQEVKHNIPKIKDAFIRVLYKGFQEKTMISEEGLLDISLIKDHLMSISNHVLKGDKVHDILVNDISIQ